MAQEPVCVNSLNNKPKVKSASSSIPAFAGCAALLLATLAVAGCDNSSTEVTTENNTETAAQVDGAVAVPATSPLMQNFSIVNGFGVPLLPYRIAKPDSAGNATPQVV